MDKEAVIQKDKKGNILFDKSTKDTEIVKVEEDIDSYMEREVLPHIPDAKLSSAFCSFPVIAVPNSSNCATFISSHRFFSVPCRNIACILSSVIE